MGRYTPPNIFFFAPDDLTTALESGTTRLLESAQITSRLGEVGEFECTYPFPRPIDDGYVAFGVLEAIGNIVIFTYTDDRYAPGAGRVRAFGDCYRIESAIVEDRGQAGPFVRLRGRSLMAELEDTAVWEPIGNATNYTTTILADHPIPGPSTSTTVTSYTAGKTKIVLVDGSAFKENDMVVIPLVGGGTMVTLVSGKDDDLPNEIPLANALAGSVASGATITRYARVVYPTGEFENIKTGAKIAVTLNSGTHTTLVEREPEPDDDEVMFVLVRDGIPGAANAGNNLVITDKSAPATNDIQQVIANVPGWTTSINGIGDGSAHVPQGASVIELLRNVSEINGTPFKQGYDAAGAKPKRRIVWGVTNSGSENKIALRNPPPSLIAGFDAQEDRGIIRGTISREWKKNVVTRLYAVGGDPAVSLRGVSDSMRSLLAANGLEIVTDTTTLGLYMEPYIRNVSLESDRVVSRRVTFSDIVPETTSLSAVLNACDTLAVRAMEWMLNHSRNYWEWSISDVEIASAVVLEVGQYVNLVRYLDGQTVRTAYMTDVIEDLITHSVTLRWDSSTDTPVFDLVLSDWVSAPTDAGRAISSSFKNYDMTARRFAQNGAQQIATMGLVISGAEGDYLPLAGGTMTGHISFSGSQTVDGVDISAHAADPDAHHNTATSGNSGISVSGAQAISAVVATDGGLELSSGLKVKKPSESGLTLDSNGLSVAPNSTGGLELNSGVRVKLPANSGIARDSTGIYLAPTTLTAATTNAVSGSGHTHAVTTTADGKASVSTILRSDSNGDMTLRYLTADKVRTPLIDTASGPLVLSPESYVSLATGKTIQSSSWTSGFLGVGWGVTNEGAGDFRFLTADELHVQAFIADTARVKVGAEWVTPSMAIVAETIGIPAKDAGAQLKVEDAPGLEGLPVFGDGDWVLARVIDRGGGLEIRNVWGQVYDYIDLGEGVQEWTFIRRDDADLTTFVASGLRKALLDRGYPANFWPGGYWYSETLAGQAGARINRGDIILGFGRSGDGWWWVTTLDPVGSPYMGISTWRDDPSVPSNRTHHLRAGNLAGINSRGAEWGIWAGGPTQGFSVSNLGADFNNIRLSMYANENGQLRLHNLDILLTQGATSNAIRGDGDISALNTGSWNGTTEQTTYYTTLDDAHSAPNHADYVTNASGAPAQLWMTLSNPSSLTNWNTVRFRVHYSVSDFTNDACVLRAQVFKSDGLTPLTDEITLANSYSRTAGVNYSNTPQAGFVTPVEIDDWNGARLRLRWDYVADLSTKTIQLDPTVPSLAIGNPIPTGYLTGGSGVWMGQDSSLYRLRIGNPTGVHLRWTGNDLILANASGNPAIRLNADGTSLFAGPMRIGPNGYIWQGTNAEDAAITSGWKLWRDTSGRGRFTTYDSAGAVQVDVDTTGRLVAGGGFTRIDKTGFHALNAALSAETVHMRGSGIEFMSTTSQDTARGINWMTGSTYYGGIVGWAASSERKVLNEVRSTSGSVTAVQLMTAINSGSSKTASVEARAGNTDANTYVLVVGDLQTTDGLRVGSTGAINRGQIVSNFAGEHDYNAIILQDTTDVAHGMTSEVETATYGVLGKQAAADGGLLIGGYSEATRALDFYGIATSGSSTKASTSLGAITMTAGKKSGSTYGGMGTNENVFVVRNSTTTVFIVDKDGDIFVNTTDPAPWDTYDDVMLVRGADMAIAQAGGHEIDERFSRWLKDNRSKLQRLGLVSFGNGTFVNTTRMQRLMMGALWQLSERISALETA